MDYQETSNSTNDDILSSNQDPSNSDCQNNEIENNVTHSVPLAAMLDERKKFQRQIEEEKSIRRQYEDVLLALGQNKSEHRNNDPIMAKYEDITQKYGEDAANVWLNQQVMNQDLAVHSQNQSVLKQVQEKHKDIYFVPEIKKAIDDYLRLGVDSSKSLNDQGFAEAVDYIASIYKAGYETASSLKAQNDIAKARMGSSINNNSPSLSSGKVFTRAEIAAMDPDVFSKYEKVIFEQMAKGLIK